MSMTLNTICGTTYSEAWANEAFEGFCLDSRYVRPKQIFIALNSYTRPEKTIEFAQAALNKGALAIISEVPLDLMPCVVCPEVRQQMGLWQKHYLQQKYAIDPPPVLAVTGTNGKTTIARLMAELLTLNHLCCAVMGTTGNGILPHLVPATHTTADALALQDMLFEYAQDGAHFVALEASSHGLVQGRLVGCDIQVAVYSNLSRDHLDFHHTLDAYATAKAQLFALPSLKTVVINLDDDYAELMLTTARQNPAQPKILTYSRQASNADFFVDQIEFNLKGAQFKLHTPKGLIEISSPLLGQFNIENLVASLAAVSAVGVDLHPLAPKLHQLVGAPGRMQVIEDNQRLFIVDYAHTPDALSQVLISLKRHVDHQLWAIFGCGGDRDRGKRPLMTQAALTHADQVVLTSDNPRTEPKAQIFADMIEGVDLSTATCQNIQDRRDAIRYAVQHAQAGDIIVIAGKGHENYQEIDGVRHWFDDVVEVKLALGHMPDAAN